MKTILAFGNPLLDITVSSKEDVLRLIQKYNLNPDGQKEIEQEEMKLLSNDIKGLEQHVSPGGCCQNSLRVLQWILKKKGHVYIFGTVGIDQEATTLKNILQSEGVNTRYIEKEDLPTGKTIALVNGLNRSLVCYIGAAELFTLNYLLAYEDFPFLFSFSEIIFIEAYFLTNRFEAAKYLVDLSKDKEKLLVFNLCGAYVFEVVPEPIKYLVKHSNIIFGNIHEYEALRSLLNYESVSEMALGLIKDAESSKYGKIIVITDGSNPIVCYSGKEIISMSPPQIDPSDIKDTTGAGDAFIGGFLAGLSMSKDIKECIKLGFYGASNIIQQSGCTIPKCESEV